MRTWSPDEDKWLKKKYPDLTIRELTSAFKQNFGYKRSEDSITRRANRLHLNKSKKFWKKHYESTLKNQELWIRTAKATEKIMASRRKDILGLTDGVLAGMGAIQPQALAVLGGRRIINTGWFTTNLAVAFDRASSVLAGQCSQETLKSVAPEVAKQIYWQVVGNISNVD